MFLCTLVEEKTQLASFPLTQSLQHGNDLLLQTESPLCTAVPGHFLTSAVLRGHCCHHHACGGTQGPEQLWTTQKKLAMPCALLAHPGRQIQLLAAHLAHRARLPPHGMQPAGSPSAAERWPTGLQRKSKSKVLRIFKQ